MSSLPPPRLGPQWLAHRFDPSADTIHFADVPRTLRRRAPFLTDEELLLTVAPLVIDRTTAPSTVGDPAPIHFVFHSAYCCSTLLANALDRPGISSTLKEPVILNDIVGWRHRGGEPARIGAALDDALRLLARPFAEDTCMIVKPSNVVNALAPAMLAMRPEARAILLYAPLEAYLASIARKGMWGRLWVRDLLRKQLRDGIVDLGFEVEDYFLLSDIQVAAVGWLAQQQLFTRLADRFPDRVRTLDSELFVARPRPILGRLAGFVSLGLTPEDIADIAAGEAFSRNAKDGRPFGSADRIAERDVARDAHAEEIEKVTIWAQAVARNVGLSLTLPGALVV